MLIKQFPIIVSFAMNINKNEGVSIKHVGLYLLKPIFGYEQFYAGLSRVKSPGVLKATFLATVTINPLIH